MKLEKTIRDIIYTWVIDNFDESEANDPSWNVELLAEYIANQLTNGGLK